MAITKDQKVAILDELKKKFGDAKGVVFAQNKGLSVEDAQTLRRGLRESNVDFKVAKKTLIKLAAKEKGYDIPDGVMDGPIGVAFGYDDEIVAAQQVSKFAKDFDALVVMGGFMEGKAIDVDVVKQLASIPSHEALLGQFVGLLMSPLSGFVGIGNGVVGGFVRTLNAYQGQRAEDEQGGSEADAQKEDEKKPEESPEPEAEAVKPDEGPAEEEEAKAEEAEAPAEEAEPPAEETEAPVEEEAKTDEEPAKEDADS